MLACLHPGLQNYLFKYFWEAWRILCGGTSLYFSVAGTFWFIPLHVPGEGRKCDVCCCRCLIFAHRGLASEFLLVSTRWCVCLLPFTIFPFFLPECPAHTCPIVFWYDLSNADPSDTHIHTCIQTEALCHCITLQSLGHTVHIYSFITMRHFVWENPCSLDPRPPLHQPQAWTAPCSCVTACLFYSASHQTLQPTQQNTKHQAESPTP